MTLLEYQTGDLQGMNHLNGKAIADVANPKCHQRLNKF